ncbi:twin-arginine translocation signal domain-containing protein, partial [Methylobacterium sp. WL18]
MNVQVSRRGLLKGAGAGPLE